MIVTLHHQLTTMSVYKRPGSSLWHYEFVIARKRYRGSTGAEDLAQAEAYEALQRSQVLQAAQDTRNALEDAVARTTLWDAAQSWLTTGPATDRKNNESRVRKLFGMEMRLIDDQWQEVPGLRFGVSKALDVAAVSIDVVEELRAARASEGNSAATIEREQSLLRVLVAHAQTMQGIGPKPPAPPPVRKRQAPKRPLRWWVGHGFAALPDASPTATK